MTAESLVLVPLQIDARAILLPTLTNGPWLLLETRGFKELLTPLTS